MNTCIYIRNLPTFYKNYSRSYKYKMYKQLALAWRVSARTPCCRSGIQLGKVKVSCAGFLQLLTPQGEWHIVNILFEPRPRPLIGKRFINLSETGRSFCDDVCPRHLANGQGKTLHQYDNIFPKHLMQNGSSPASQARFLGEIIISSNFCPLLLYPFRGQCLQRFFPQHFVFTDWLFVHRYAT